MKNFIFPLLLLASFPVFCSETLNIDPSHTAVVFQWSHFGFSNPVARLEKVDGKVTLDASDLTKSSVDVKFPLDGLRTGSEHLDKRLKTAEFFDAGKYPEITFKSTKVEKGAMDTLKITGDLTVHGVTKSVLLDAKINKIQLDSKSKARRAGFDAETTLRRSDYGITKYVPAVTDDILVRITVEANVEE